MSLEEGREGGREEQEAVQIEGSESERSGVAPKGKGSGLMVARRFEQGSGAVY